MALRTKTNALSSEVLQREKMWMLEKSNCLIQKKVD